MASPMVPGADWPQWRGPDRTDHSPDRDLLKQWPRGGPKRLWLNESAGIGYSGFSIADGRLYTQGARDRREFLLAIDAATGRELWSAPVGEMFTESHGDGPRATPTVDGERVYVMGGNGNLVCATTADGGIVWETSMTQLGGKVPGWGYTESVLVVGDLVVCTPGGSQGTMAGLDKATGKVVWRSRELTDAAQYASPILIEHGGNPQIVQLVMKQFFGVNPSSGDVLWRQAWPMGRVAVIPTPIHHNGHIYITSGYGAGCTLARLNPAGTSIRTIYSNDVMANHHGGVILVGDHIYGYSDTRRGRWICQEFLTGKEVWASEALDKGAIHYADGMFYCLGQESGDVVLIEASPQRWTERGRFTLEPQSRRRSGSGKIWTHPVVLEGRLYLRDQELLHCYDVKG
jgi:outer membrane protein assembly factor BamB